MAMGNLPPFEDREAYGGFFPALLQTWVGACFRPMEFFQTVGNSQELGPALLFGVLVGWVAVVLSSLVGLVVQAPLIPLMGQQREVGIMFAAGAGQVVLMVVLGWLFVLLGIFIVGLIVHLFLMIFGGAQQGLTVTLRVIAYAMAPNIFGVVPFIGGCVAGIWGLVLEIIGLAAAHRTDTWRAALAVIAPVVLCICALALLLVPVFMAAYQKARGVTLQTEMWRPLMFYLLSVLLVCLALATVAAVVNVLARDKRG